MEKVVVALFVYVVELCLLIGASVAPSVFVAAVAVISAFSIGVFVWYKYFYKMDTWL